MQFLPRPDWLSENVQLNGPAMIVVVQDYQMSPCYALHLDYWHSVFHFIPQFRSWLPLLNRLQSVLHVSFCYLTAKLE